jgi:hypothetical protein
LKLPLKTREDATQLLSAFILKNSKLEPLRKSNLFPKQSCREDAVAAATE